MEEKNRGRVRCRLFSGDAVVATSKTIGHPGVTEVTALAMLSLSGVFLL